MTIKSSFTSVCLSKKISDLDLSVGTSENCCIKTHNSSMHIGSFVVVLKELKEDNLSMALPSKYASKADDLKAKDNNIFDASKSKEVSNIHSKSRMALFQGGEDDEPMAPQIIPASNPKVKCHDLHISKENNQEEIPCVQIGSMLVKLKGSKDYTKCFMTFPR